MHLLVYDVMKQSPAANLSALWVKIKIYYVSHSVPSRYNKMKMTMFGTGKESGPKLRGKAAQVKCMCKVLQHIWNKLMDKESEVHKQISVLLQCMTKMEEILHDHKTDHVLPVQIAEKFKKYCFAMLQIQQKLAFHFAEKGKKMFTLTQKGHFMAHIASLAHLLNPIRTWCYKGEDMMKIFRGVTESCVRGLSAPAVAVKAASHYRLGLHLEFEQLQYD